MPPERQQCRNCGNEMFEWTNTQSVYGTIDRDPETEAVLRNPERFADVHEQSQTVICGNCGESWATEELVGEFENVEQQHR